MSARLNVARILREQVTLEVEGLWRMYLNLNLPSSQLAGRKIRLCTFIIWPIELACAKLWRAAIRLLERLYHLAGRDAGTLPSI